MIVMESVPTRKIGTYPAVIAIGVLSSPMKIGSAALAEEKRAK
jgi:hypothetical protein